MTVIKFKNHPVPAAQAKTHALKEWVAIAHHSLLRSFMGSPHYCSFGEHFQSGFISQMMPLSSPWAHVNKLGPSTNDGFINGGDYF